MCIWVNILHIFPLLKFHFWYIIAVGNIVFRALSFGLFFSFNNNNIMSQDLFCSIFKNVNDCNDWQLQGLLSTSKKRDPFMDGATSILLLVLTNVKRCLGNNIGQFYWVCKVIGCHCSLSNIKVQILWHIHNGLKTPGIPLLAQELVTRCCLGCSTTYFWMSHYWAVCVKCWLSRCPVYSTKIYSDL